MTHAELDEIAARVPMTVAPVMPVPGSHHTPRVYLSVAERDALLALAREGLAAREDRTFAVPAVTGAFVLVCQRCRRKMRSATVLSDGQMVCSDCATPPTSGPDGTT